MHREKRWSYLLLTLCLLLTACSMSDEKRLAERGVEEYHERYNRRAFSEIFDNEYEELKRNSNRESFMLSIEAMRNGQGAVKTAKMINDEYEYALGGKRIKLSYDVDLEKGQAKEQFIFNIVGDHALLSGYKFIAP